MAIYFCAWMRFFGQVLMLLQFLSNFTTTGMYKKCCSSMNIIFCDSIPLSPIYNYLFCKFRRLEIERKQWKSAFCITDTRLPANAANDILRIKCQCARAAEWHFVFYCMWINQLEMSLYRACCGANTSSRWLSRESRTPLLWLWYPSDRCFKERHGYIYSDTHPSLTSQTLKVDDRYYWHPTCSKKSVNGNSE